jgi:TonB family protein
MSIPKQLLTFAALLALTLGATGTSFAASLPDAGQRKQVSNRAPEYPDLARKMNISGTVRMEVAIAPDGSVTSVKALGGNPVLIESALKAARQWTYERSSQASTLVVAVKFDNQ